MKFNVVNLLLIATLITMSITTDAQYQTKSNKKEEVRFFIRVETPEYDIDRKIGNIVENELRKLYDVETIEGRDTGMWVLRLTTIELPHRYVTAAVITKALTPTIIDTLGIDNYVKLLGDDEYLLVNSILTDQYLYKQTYLFSYNKQDINQLCKDIVSKFNTNYLNKIRRQKRR